MDVIGRLRAWALASPRVLVIVAPGSRPLRWRVEAELDRRGWAPALSPADADVLVVIGTPGPELAAAVELVWGQIPRPRYRADVLSEAEVEEGLAAAAVGFATGVEHAEENDGDAAPGQARSGHAAPMDHSRHEAAVAVAGADHAGHGATAGREPAGHEGMDPPGHEGMEHSGHGAMAGMDHSGGGAMAGMDHSGGGAMAGMDHSGVGAMAGMDHSGGGAMAGMDHSGDGGMDHSGHHMHHGGEVAGLPMAQTGPDRDGLTLDVLRVSLGPVLPNWPTGLLLRAELQGDVVTGAEFSWLDAGDDAAADEGLDLRRSALDQLASLLEVAGWSTAARDVRRVRDGLASPDPGERAAAEHRVQRLMRRVRRSRALAWSLRGIGGLEDRHPGTEGDVLDRMRRWCDAASGAAVSGPDVLPLDVVASVLQGAEVAAARLIVASVDLRRSVARPEPEVVGA